MTVASEIDSISYAGNGVTVAFAIPYNFLSNSDIEVARRDSSGDSTVLATGFTITGAGTGSGTCTFTTAPAAGYDIVISRKPQLMQPMDLVANDRFPAETVETAHDRQTYVSQYLRQLIKRCLQVPAGDAAIDSSVNLGAASSRANKVLTADATGAIAWAASIGSTLLTSALMGTTLNSLKRTAAEIAVGVVPADYAYPELNVLRYGADPTGATDSDTAFSNAILVAAYRGSYVYVPSGKYVVAAPIRLRESTGLQGAGCMGGAYAGTVQGSSIWAKSTMNLPARGLIESYNAQAGGLQEFCPVRDISIFGNRTNGAIIGAGLLLKAVFINTTIRDVMIQEVEGDGIQIDGASGGGPIQIENVWINNVEGHCLVGTGGFQHVRIRDVAFERWGRHAASGTKNAIRWTSAAGTDVARFLLVDGFYSELEPGKNHDCIYLENLSYADLRNLAGGGGSGVETGSFIRWRQTAGSAPYVYPRGSSVLGFRADNVYLGTAGVKAYAKTVWDEANSVTRTDDWIQRYVAPEPIITIGSAGAPAFANAWVTRAGGYQAAGYWIDGEGFVNLCGGIKTGTVGLAAFTLPAGARPVATLEFPCPSNGATGAVTISSAGVVTPIAPSNNTYVSLDGIRFKALA